MMDGLVHQFVTEMIGRVDGPMSFRLILQPAVALCFAFRDGRQDCRDGRAPYTRALFTDAAHRTYLMEEGWKGYGKVFVFAFALDLVYQYFAIAALRIPQGVATACILALLPYTLSRGPFNRLCSYWAAGKQR